MKLHLINQDNQTRHGSLTPINGTCGILKFGHCLLWTVNFFFGAHIFHMQFHPRKDPMCDTPFRLTPLFVEVSEKKKIIMDWLWNDNHWTKTANTISSWMDSYCVCCYCSSTTTTHTISHSMTYILPTIIVTLAAIGLLSNFFFIFFMGSLDEANNGLWDS